MTERTEREPVAVVAEEEATASAAADEMQRSGWTLLGGWSLPVVPWDVTERRIVCSGEVSGPEDVSDAVLAAVRGARLVVLLHADPPVASVLLDDLRRLGPVEHRQAVSGPARQLDGDQRRLLELLAEGVAIGEAAEQLFLSRRTAERRLAGARRALGVRTTSEAIVLVGGPPPAARG